MKIMDKKDSQKKNKAKTEKNKWGKSYIERERAK